MVSKLHSEFHFLNGRISKNRFSLAPMTTSQSLINGGVGHNEFLWLKQCAQGGFGLVITCASHISREGQGWYNQMGIFDNYLIPSLKVLSGTLKAFGSLAILQLYHGGLRSPEEVLKHNPVNLNELSREKISQIIEDFGDAAERAERAGFDGIELHGANGYLITQFISKQTNYRTDEYGGSLENRSRFFLEVLKNCRQKVSRDFIVGARMSPENFGAQKGLNLDENIEISQWLVEFGLDYLHISTWNALSPHLLSKFRAALPSEFPIIIAGGLRSIESCDEALDAGASLVALGKIAIGNPYFPEKSKNPFYTPNLPPYSEEYIDACRVSPVFKKLLYNFPDFLDN